MLCLLILVCNINKKNFARAKAKKKYNKKIVVVIKIFGIKFFGLRFLTNKNNKILIKIIELHKKMFTLTSVK